MTSKFLLVLALVAVAQPALSADKMTSCLTAIANKLDHRAAEVINHLSGLGRQLLAARSYLRSADDLADRWSWSQQQIDAYQGSHAQQQLDLEINQVSVEFEFLNPGFTLHFNPDVRSLEVQIEHWNSNTSVAAAAEELQVSATTFLTSGAIAKASASDGCDSFAIFLVAYVPGTAATIAAPGLSSHGQMRAVDFQIVRDGQTVAATDTHDIERDWIQAGWRDKLAAAVIASGAQFVGPMEKPDEPWHYTYRGTLEDCCSVGIQSEQQ